jgi:DNA polymerase V
MRVNGLRLKYELLGLPCQLLESAPPVRQSFCDAPSFGDLIPDQAIVTQALLTYLARVAERLRRQHTAANVLTVFLHTNRFRKNRNGEAAKQYYNSQSVTLPHPTNSTAELAPYAVAALNNIFKFGYRYQKVGIILSDFVAEDYRQPDLFRQLPDERLNKLSQVVDKLNYRFGRDRVRLAGQGFDPTWRMKPQFLSPRYTTCWQDILAAE